MTKESSGPLKKDYKSELSPQLKAVVEEGMKKNYELLKRLAD